MCNYKKQETSGFTSYKLHRRSSTNKNSRGTRQTNKTGGTSQLACPVLCWKFTLWAFSWPQGALLLVGGPVGMKRWRHCWGGKRDVDMNDIDNYWIFLHGSFCVKRGQNQKPQKANLITDVSVVTFGLAHGLMQCMLHCEAAQKSSFSSKRSHLKMGWLPSFKPNSSTLKIGPPQDFQGKTLSPDHGFLQELLVKEIPFFWWRKSQFCEQLNPGMQSCIFSSMQNINAHDFDVHWYLGRWSNLTWLYALFFNWVETPTRWFMSVSFQYVSYRHCFAMPFTSEYLKPLTIRETKDLPPHLGLRVFDHTF